MSPTARTTASRCSTATANTRRSGTICTGPARCVAAAGQESDLHRRRAWSGHVSQSEDAKSWSATLHRRCKGKAHRAARWRARRRDQEPGKFLAPHGVALDSKGDIYVGEVGVTNWKTSFPDSRCRRKCAAGACRSWRRLRAVGWAKAQFRRPPSARLFWKKGGSLCPPYDTGQDLAPSLREESDEAIHSSACRAMDCFASLAMTMRIECAFLDST